MFTIVSDFIQHALHQFSEKVKLLFLHNNSFIVKEKSIYWQSYVKKGILKIYDKYKKKLPEIICTYNTNNIKIYF